VNGIGLESTGWPTAVARKAKSSKKRMMNRAAGNAQGGLTLSNRRQMKFPLALREIFV
jgi:hypothetical protein